MPAHKKHGIVYTPTYSSWHAMMMRCYDSKQTRVYSTYGAIGIKCCEFIRASPLSLVMLIGHRPDTKTQKYTIDRIKNEHGYYCGQCAECLERQWPLNIRWATRTNQNRNKSDNRIVEINGVSKCMSQWAQENGLKVITLFGRLRRGWTGERLISKPRKADRSIKIITINGIAKRNTEWAKELGINLSTFNTRLKAGWTEGRLSQKV